MSVKASKQFRMVVVPYRPWYKAAVFCLFLLALAAFSWLTYQYGLNAGIATRVEVVKERDDIRDQLDERLKLIERQRQEIAELKVGGQIDSRATEEVRQTIETLQNEVAELNEEIRFYKGVMLPNVEEKGLRIERLDLRNSGEPNRYRYNLLLTQVVEKHEYIQGGVKINLLGLRGNAESSVPLEQLSDGKASMRFKFRYFQNIDGEFTIPAGFEPRTVMVVAEGSGAQRIEKRFQWRTFGG